MLVLSRSLRERIVFPHLNVAIEVVAVRGNRVRLGIEAPPEIQVLREELARDPAVGADARELPRGTSHAARNRLNAVALALCLLEKQLQAGRTADMEATLRTALRDLEELDRKLAGPEPAAEAGSEGRRALLVEDDANERELLAGILRLSGFQVATAPDGSEALEYLATFRRPDVVLLDMGLPRCDGPTTVASIRQNPALAGLRVVAVTGRTFADLNVPLGPHGVDAWFTKPINPARFLASLQQTFAQN